jgi:exopolysaccharide biosynthesis WecB/TagA/CpsF family protein
MRRTVRLLNVDVDDVTMDEVLDVRDGAILTLHVDSLAKLQKDRRFYEAVRSFDVVTCDSQILYFAARLLGTPVRERVSGSDYLPRLYSRYAGDPGTTIFLCGAGPGIAEEAARRINAKVGRDVVVGTYSPPPGWIDDPAEVDHMIELINESKATVLVLGLAAGQQEVFIQRHRRDLPAVRLLLPLGGTIDYEAGAVRRPPPFVTTLGLEWLWRLVRQPGRRWRRYLVHQPPVLYHLARQRLGRYRDPFAAGAGRCEAR